MQGDGHQGLGTAGAQPGRVLARELQEGVQVETLFAPSPSSHLRHHTESIRGSAGCRTTCIGTAHAHVIMSACWCAAWRHVLMAGVRAADASACSIMPTHVLTAARTETKAWGKGRHLKVAAMDPARRQLDARVAQGTWAEGGLGHSMRARGILHMPGRTCLPRG